MPLNVTSNGYFVADDYQVNQNGFQTQQTPRVTALPDGNFVAVWQDVDSFNEPGIHARIYDGNGRTIGDEFQVPASAAAYQVEPAIAVLSNGGFVITWSEESPYPAVFDIKAQVFDALGQKVGSEFVANSSIDGFQTDSEVIGLAGGGFAIVWSQAENSGYDNIRGQAFAADGTRVGGEFIVNDARLGDKLAPTMTALADGRFVVSWLDFESDGQNLSYGTQAQILNANGTKSGAQFSLNDFVPGTQTQSGLIGLPGGGFIGAWVDDGNPYGTPNGHKGVWAQAFDAAGNRVGAAQQVTTTVSNAPLSLEYVTGKGVLVTWTTLAGEAMVLGGQFLNDTAVKVGDSFLLGGSRNSAKQLPDVAALDDGQIVFAWQDFFTTGSSDLDVRAQILFSVVYGVEGADSFVGTQNRDFYVGLGGNDTAYGGAEDDGLDGGGGDDTLYGEQGNDLLYGGLGNDRLNGGAGNDSLIGEEGQDVLAGGVGDDSYLIDAGDTIVEAAGEGRDTVYVTTGYALGAGAAVEVLTVYDRATTNALTLSGNEFANSLYGNMGSNGLIGGGGSDVLYGLGGDDAYIVDDASDQVVEAAGQGWDTVYALGSYALAFGSEVEVLTAYDRAGTIAINLTGNDASNLVYGNMGNNGLVGGGGTDTLYGLGGDDSYIVDDASDRVIELAGQGWDTVYALGSYALAADAEVEVLTAYDRSGTTAINLTGSASGNILYGNMGVNGLIGGGGSDTLYGLGGDDSYIVDDASDQVIEFAGQGWDTVYALGDFTLSAGSEVETLTAYDRDAATALKLTGNALANNIYGDAGANVLDGKGGADTLYGFSGADKFQFSTTLQPGMAPTVIGDFVSGMDKIALDDAVFGGIAGNALSSMFVTGTAAADADDRLIYDSATGALWYDADGTGAGAAIHFATLQGHPTLTAGDFLIF